MIDYLKGQRIRISAKPEWGIGEVLGDSSGGKMSAFFVGAGLKKLSLKYVSPEVLEGPSSEHPLLDNLTVVKKNGQPVFRSLESSKQDFLLKFPKGFSDPLYIEEERDYKIEAHNLSLDMLERNAIDDLLKNGDHEEVCRRALAVTNKTNLIFPNEKMALRDGLKSADYKELFATSLRELLYGDNSEEARFTQFADTLEALEAAKWTTASYFWFLHYPSVHMFVKPTITRNAADICGFNIQYRSEVNWLTYHLIQSLARYLSEELADLNPRDMVDVQSFLWVVGQAN